MFLAKAGPDGTKDMLCLDALRKKARSATLLPKRKLRLVSFHGLDLNALEFEHTALGSRPARGGEAADPVARRKDPVARNDQGHRIACHRLTDFARTRRAAS